MLHEDDQIRLRHMLEAAREAVGYARGRAPDDLVSDRQLTHSLVRCVEIVGEAANHISEECCAQHPEIRWRGIIGMRNRLIHAYFDINAAILWRSVTEELPPLIAQLERILET